MSKKIITNLLNYALQEKAQHLIIYRQKQKISLDYHLPDGELRHLTLPKKLEQSFFTNLNEILAIKAGEIIDKKYHKIIYKNSHLPIYLTVLPAEEQEKIVINLIKKPQKSWRLNQLGLKNVDLVILKKYLAKRSGLIIISSQPGGGRSTTLEALLPILNKSTLSLYFLGAENPQSIPGINLLNSTAINWKKLRQYDSEIILADNLEQDWELTEALLTALTGRLVIITLKAKNSKEVIKRIKNLNKSPNLIKDSLKIIISQNLIPLQRPKNNLSSLKRDLIGQFDILKL